MLWQQAIANWDHIFIWGLAATIVLTSVLYGSQGMGLSRLSLPYLFGTFVLSNRYRATVLGFVLYMVGGWAFALLYFLLFAAMGRATWWAGALIGTFHALFLLLAFLPILPYLHPRMATECDGPTAVRRLEPPGFLGLNYGRRTPITTIAGHALYGLLLGYGYDI